MERATNPITSMDAAALVLAQRSAEDSVTSDSFSRQLLAAMYSFREGNFGVRLPQDLTGVEGKIADAFNDIVALAQGRARETGRVSHVVGREGKLKQRMSVPGARGGWAEEISAINTLIDDFVFPTVEVTRGRRPTTRRRIPSLGAAGEHHDRPALGVHIRSDPRRP